ncbi:MAG: hypothetical protein ABIK19_05720 [candidate division WOR-3 bacterium]
MKNKTLFKTIVKITLISMVLAMSMFQFSLPAQAGALTNIKDTLSRLQKGVDANHAIAFTTATALTGGDTIKIQFDPDTDAFTLKATLDAADLTVTGMTLVSTCDGGGDEVTVAFDKTAPDENITFTVCEGDTVSAGAKTVTVSNNEITNPASSGSYKIAITTSQQDSGSLVVAIIENDQVQITATVDPTFTFSISPNTCALGTLTTANVKRCTYTSTVSTNAVSGYTATVIAEGGANYHLDLDSDNTKWINDVSDGTVNANNEEYGLATDVGEGAFPDYDNDENGCNEDTSEPAAAITDSTKTYSIASEPVNNDVVTLCHIAAISSTTEAGTYSQTVTLVATGTF